MSAKDEIREDLHLLYKVSAQDIAFFKLQQWRVTNYAALIYGAVVIIARMLQPLGPVPILGLVVIAFITAVGGCYILGMLSYDIRVRRARLRKIRRSKQITDEFRSAWSALPKQAAGNEVAISLLMHAVLVIGFIVVVCLIYPYYCPLVKEAGNGY